MILPPKSCTSDDSLTARGVHAAGYLVVVVERDGRALYSPNLPELVGRRPWELCWRNEDQALLREAFIEACMFRHPQEAISSSLRIDAREFDFEVWLDPTGADLVICRMVRIFSGRLSRREKDVLALVAGGASNAEICRVLGTREATVRSHLRNMRDKLGVARPEGLLLAAVGLQDGPAGNKSDSELNVN